MRPILYYSPAACSIACHAALREAEADFELRLVSTRDGSTQKPEFLAVNPKGLVPALARDGEIVAECSAVLLEIAFMYPKAGLLPSAAKDRARALEWTAWCSNTMHESFRACFRPYKYVDENDDAAIEAVKAFGAQRVQRNFADAEARLKGQFWAAGDAFSIADCHLLVFAFWALRVKLDLRAVAPAYADLVSHMLERPAIQATLQAEGLTAPL